MTDFQSEAPADFDEPILHFDEPILEHLRELVRARDPIPPDLIDRLRRLLRVDRLS